VSTNVLLSIKSLQYISLVTKMLVDKTLNNV